MTYTLLPPRVVGVKGTDQLTIATQQNPLDVQPNVDYSLTGEQTVSNWFPEVTASFNNPSALPSAVREAIKTGGATSSTASRQLIVTVPPGGSYLIETKQQVKYTNGQETRGLATTVFESAPAAGHTAILWLLSKDRNSGFGIGHRNGEWVFAHRFAGVDDYVTRPNWAHDDLITDDDGSAAAVNYQAPQINRLRMLYLGFGPLSHEVRNNTHAAGRQWPRQHSKHFINDPTRLTPNLSDPNLGMALEITNTGSGDIVARTNSWGVGPVLGDIGEQQPDGDRIYPRADGVAVDVDGNAIETFTPLLANATWDLTGPADSDGHNQIEIYIRTDQPSATGGLRLYPTPDANAAAPLYGPPLTFTVTQEDADEGFAVFPVPVDIDGFKVEYENGGTDQGIFWLVVTMRKESRSLAQRSMTGKISLTDSGAIDWVRAFGFTDAGAFKAQRYTTLGNPALSISEHEVDTPLKSDTGVDGDAVPVTATASKIIDFTNIPVGATGVQLQAGGANSKAMYFHHTEALANQTNALFELSAGQPQYLGVGENLTHDIWAAMQSGSGRLRIMWIYGGGA